VERLASVGSWQAFPHLFNVCGYITGELISGTPLCNILWP